MKLGATCLLSSALINRVASDPSIEDLRDVLKLYPYSVSTSWSLAHLQHPIPNSHRPVVEMLCCNQGSSVLQVRCVQRCVYRDWKRALLQSGPSHAAQLVTKHSTMVQVIAASSKGALTLERQCALFLRFLSLILCADWPASQALCSLLCGMLKVDPAARLSALQTLRHVYFSAKEN